MKIELPYLYLEHISTSGLTNGVIEIFLFDGAESNIETLQPCTENTLLQSLLVGNGSDYCSGGDTFLNNRIFAAQWCGNDTFDFIEQDCIAQDIDIWFDLQYSNNEKSLPYIQDIPFTPSTTLWEFGQCPVETECWGWRGNNTDIDNFFTEAIDLSIFNSQFSGQFNIDFADWSESVKKDHELVPEDHFYIIVRTGASDLARNWLGNSYQHFAIPKNIFRKDRKSVV